MSARVRQRLRPVQGMRHFAQAREFYPLARSGWNAFGVASTLHLPALPPHLECHSVRHDALSLDRGELRSSEDRRLGDSCYRRSTGTSPAPASSAKSSIQPPATCSPKPPGSTPPAADRSPSNPSTSTKRCPKSPPQARKAPIPDRTKLAAVKALAASGQPASLMLIPALNLKGTLAQTT